MTFENDFKSNISISFVTVEMVAPLLETLWTFEFNPAGLTPCRIEEPISSVLRDVF